MQEIQNLPDDSKDIQKSNNLHRYINRPSSMEHVCLADYTSLHRMTSKKSQKPTFEPMEQFNDNEECQEVEIRKR
jgi:hypothetical protein